LVRRVLDISLQAQIPPVASDRKESLWDSAVRESAVRESPAPYSEAKTIQHQVCLQTMWAKVAYEYFPDLCHLNDYLVIWSSRRQKRTLASVNLKTQRVLVAMELNDPLFFVHLPALLYHEMCHAVISTDVTMKNGRRQWHGKQFKILEKQHPGIPALDCWIKAGGWRYAVARHRARDAHRRRKSRTA